MPINPVLDHQIESFSRGFDVKRFWHEMTGTNDDPPSLSFIEPTQADIEAIQRDLAPHAEACARK